MFFPLDPNVYNDDAKKEPIRAGFGRGLKAAGETNPNIVALCADLTDSTKMSDFKAAFPERFIEMGVAEQNLVTVASGLARAGKIPFTSSYAAFSPGRNWEQIRTTIALNDQPVKVIGSHAGVSVGPDGATHQMLEDIALMRALPNMIVIAPGDSLEAERATKAVAENGKPIYMRLAREKTAIFSTDESPFEVGKAYVLKEGHDITLLGTGTMTAQILMAAKLLEEKGIHAEVVHVPTIKPLDNETIIASIRKTGRALTAEEAQMSGGFGGAIAELLGDKLPTPLKRVGMKDRFGESGDPDELIAHFGLDGPSIARTAEAFINEVPRYHQGF
jgi:transketolase